ncbi:MAG: PatB family C-S lyase [Anaerolineaceae bacterium]|nr:PatB family C-S lyase [Anaerolineaceae bacterium]
MNTNFDNLPNRRATESVKWNLYDEDVLPLWVADMDFSAPSAVIQALHERVDHGIFGYAIPLPALVETIVERMEKLYKWKVLPEDICFIPGVVPGFNLVCHALLKPGEEVLIQPPVYPPFLSAGASVRAKHRDAPLTLESDGSYSINFNEFEKTITPQTRLFLLCNPHNPVGRVFRRDELEQMAQICIRHNIPICSDEIHCDLLFSGQQHIPIASLDEEVAQQTITLMAPSKTFNIAGLDFSIAIIQNKDLRKQVMEARGGMVPSVNLLGQVAALAAYRDSQEWLDEVLSYMEINRNILCQYVNEKLPGIKMWQPEGTYLAWLDCRDAAISKNPYEFFLQKARVALNDGEKFGQGGKGFVRVNFGCPRFVLLDALERMRAALVQR